MSVAGRQALIFLFFSWMQFASQRKSTEPGPKVTIIIQEKKYCRGDPFPISLEHQSNDAITLRLKANADYLNIGGTPLIIPTTHQVSAIIVSRSARFGEEGQFAVPFKRRQGPSNEAPSGLDISNPFNPLFTIAQPGKGLNVPFGEYIVLQVHNPSSPSARTELLGQKLYLRLELAHWNLSQRFADELARKWKQFGRLWTGQVISQPIEVHIPASPPIADCSHELRM